MCARFNTRSLKLLAATLVAVAVVLGAGIVIGQAPAMFGVDDEPEASITFEDQTSNGTAVEVSNVSLSDGGFIVVTNSAGDTLVVSEYLGAGSHENITISDPDEDTDAELFGRLTATVHQDTTDDGEYTFEESDGEEDRPYIQDGYPVSDTASVTLEEHEEGEELASDSFRVEEIDVPSPASTNESVPIDAVVHNPTDVDTRQAVELRVDGEVLERQIIDLEAAESSDISYSLDTSTLEPGERTIGVYTTDDGAQGLLAVEYDIEPTLEILEEGDGEVFVNASLPEDGFLTVENESAIVRGTSDNLTAGDHENVTIDYDDGADDGDETLSVVMYAGSMDGYDEEDGFPDADPITIDGEAVQVAIADDDDDLEAG